MAQEKDMELPNLAYCVFSKVHILSLSLSSCKQDQFVVLIEQASSTSYTKTEPDQMIHRRILTLLSNVGNRDVRSGL